MIENCQKIEILNSPPPENVTENQSALDEYFSLVNFFENYTSTDCNVDDYCILRDNLCDHSNDCRGRFEIARFETANFLDGTDFTDEEKELCPSM